MRLDCHVVFNKTPTLFNVSSSNVLQALTYTASFLLLWYLNIKPIVLTHYLL